jgi:polar amino acid transport system substrate-binding protein
MQHTSTKVVVGIGLAVIVGLSIIVRLQQDQSLRRLQQVGVIRIGYASEPPYAFLSTDGEVTGEFPEAAKRLVADLKIERISWIETNFDALIPELESGRFDVIAAGLCMTPERAQRVAFSIPLVHVQQSLLVRDGNPHQLTAYADAQREPKIKLAAIAGSTEEQLLYRLGLNDDQLIVVPDARTGKRTVAEEIAHGLALTAPTIRWMVRHDQQGATAMAEPFRQTEAGVTGDSNLCGFAFRQEERALRTAWNRSLRAWMKSADHLDLLKTFGFLVQELPAGMSIEETPLP